MRAMEAFPSQQEIMKIVNICLRLQARKSSQHAADDVRRNKIKVEILFNVDLIHSSLFALFFTVYLMNCLFCGA